MSTYTGVTSFHKTVRFFQPTCIPSSRSRKSVKLTAAVPTRIWRLVLSVPVEVWHVYKYTFLQSFPLSCRQRFCQTLLLWVINLVFSHCFVAWWLRYKCTVMSMTLWFQHKLKSSQRDKVRQFMAFTQASEKTALHCLTVHDWKLDVAVDNYFQVPERYSRDTKPALDRRKIEQIFNKYKGL